MPQLNQQPIEKLDSRIDGTVDVHSIFKTIQGEGPFCGTPCVFVRLAGCNLQCPWCDTDYTSNRETMTPNEVLFHVKQAWNDVQWRPPGLVVITGGEPLRQQLSELLDTLMQEGFYVQIETNGTLPPPADIVFNTDVHKRSGAYIVCSPKTGKMNFKLAMQACCFKYVVSYDSQSSVDGLPMLALGHSANPVVSRPPMHNVKPIYLQPMDAKDEAENQRNVQAAVEACLRFGYILQLQIHKLIGVE